MQFLGLCRFSNQQSLVSRTTDLGNGVQYPAKGRDFSLRSHVQSNGGVSPGVKWQEREIELIVLPKYRMYGA